MNKKKYIADFEKSLDVFVNELQKYVSTETGEWTIKGFIDIYKNIYTISSDTKIVSKVIVKVQEILQTLVQLRILTI